MIIFSNHAADHIARHLQLPIAQYAIKQFSDGEIYIKIEQKISHETIWVLACTQPPAENLLELFFLLDALSRRDAQHINLLFPYFGYARQAHALDGEASSAQLICTILKMFPLANTYVIHAHSAELLNNFLPITNLIDFDYFCSIAAEYDIIAAPDKGAFEFAKQLGNTCNKPVVFLHKTRPEHERVNIEAVDGNVSGKKILLVDDMIATGRTLVESAQALHDLGAHSVGAAATHGLFTDDASTRLAKSPLTAIHVTNTIKDTYSDEIKVYDINSFIKQIITQN